jgi:hypothetical protein
MDPLPAGAIGISSPPAPRQGRSACWLYAPTRRLGVAAVHEERASRHGRPGPRLRMSSGSAVRDRFSLTKARVSACSLPQSPDRRRLRLFRDRPNAGRQTRSSVRAHPSSLGPQAHVHGLTDWRLGSRLVAHRAESRDTGGSAPGPSPTAPHRRSSSRGTACRTTTGWRSPRSSREVSGEGHAADKRASSSSSGGLDARGAEACLATRGSPGPDAQRHQLDSADRALAAGSRRARCGE